MFPASKRAAGTDFRPFRKGRFWGRAQPVLGPLVVALPELVVGSSSIAGIARYSRSGN